MNYEELVKALRSASTVSTAWEKLMHDAAAAIEELQAIAHSHCVAASSYWEELEELKAQLPKRGEWIDRYDEEDKPFFKRKYVCSACSHWNTYGKSKYCPNCGAKMEVQDGV